MLVYGLELEMNSCKWEKNVDLCVSEKKLFHKPASNDWIFSINIGFTFYQLFQHLEEMLENCLLENPEKEHQVENQYFDARQRNSKKSSIFQTWSKYSISPFKIVDVDQNPIICSIIIYLPRCLMPF